MSKFGDLLKGKTSTPVSTPVVEEISPVVEETPVEETSNESLETMSKKELEDYGRTIGIELDRRHSKKDLIEEVKAAL